MDIGCIVKNLNALEGARNFVDGSARTVVQLRTAIIGSGVYQCGWKWSLHAGTQTGKASEKHVGFIVSGHMVVQDALGIETTLGPGDAFEVGPGHDAWVVGNEPCVALDFQPKTLSSHANGD